MNQKISDNNWICVCGKAFKSLKAISCHQRQSIVCHSDNNMSIKTGKSGPQSFTHRESK